LTSVENNLKSFFYVLVWLRFSVGDNYLTLQCYKNFYAKTCCVVIVSFMTIFISNFYYSKILFGLYRMYSFTDPIFIRVHAEISTCIVQVRRFSSLSALGSYIRLVNSLLLFVSKLKSHCSRS